MSYANAVQAAHQSRMNILREAWIARMIAVCSIARYNAADLPFALYAEHCAFETYITAARERPTNA